MTKFLDGPAAGITLSIRRAPVFLRVVRDHAGRWDALDQLSDTPRYGETVHVYRKASNDGSVHLRPGGWFQMATYRLHPEQPDVGTARSTNRWRAWCEAEVEKIIQPPETA